MPHLQFTFWLVLIFVVAVSAENTVVEINSISIKGNKRTKAATILRELSFKVADQVNKGDLDSLLELNKLRLLNTSLFNSVEFALIDSMNTVDKVQTNIQITVKERWYFFPSPYFNIADRSFNAWWKQNNFSPKFVDFGLQLTQENLTGRNDRLRFLAHTGYTNKFQLEYKLPYFDKEKIYGIIPKINYYTNRRALVANQNDKQVFYPDTIPSPFSPVVQSHFETGITFTRRKDIRITKSIALRYERNKLLNTLAVNEAYPSFFVDRNSSLQFFGLAATIELDFRNIGFYPTKGWYHKTSIERAGLGIFKEVEFTKILNNSTLLHAFNTKFSMLLNLKTQLSFPQKQPYYFTRGLGYGEDVIRAYENYVLDGQHYFMFRTALRYKIVHFTIENPIRFIEQFQTAPFTIYAKVFNEIGRVWYLPEKKLESLANQWLPSTGLGLDITSFYDLVLGIEYGINKKGEHALVLQFNFKY